MKHSKRLLSVLLILLMAITMVMPASADQNVPDAINRFANRVVGYFPYYRMEYLDSIDFSAVTHVNLSFLTYKNGTFGFEFTDSDIQRIKAKCDANGVKLLIALGGGGGFSISDDPVGTAASRTAFINGIMSYVDRYDLDGVDIDTEIESGTFWANFDPFIAELSARLKADDKLLTMAVSPWFTNSMETGTYNYFDFLNVMSYDENAGTGPVASMEFMYDQLDHYMGKGISVDKLVVGIPFYGYIANGGWNGGKTYAEILADNINNKNSDYSSSFGGVYYNGETTIREKAEISKNYGGIMIWELGQDSFDENSLLAIVKDVMTEGGTISTLTPVSNLHTTAVTASTVSFSWTASPDAVKYQIYQGTELIGTTTSTSYNVMNLSALTSYIFKVAAVSATNEVSKKVNLGITMPAGAARDFPTWTNGVDFPKNSQVLYDGKIYYAKWYSVNEQPGGAHYYAWEYLGEVAPDNELPIIISTDSISLDIGESATLDACVYPANTAYTWSTSNGAVATVSGGVITAVSQGTATITAGTVNGDTAICTVTVGSSGGETVDPEPKLPDAYIFKVNSINSYWTTYDYSFTTGVACTFVDSITYVPFRDIANAAGASSIDYNSHAGTVTIVNSLNVTYSLTMNSKECVGSYNGSTFNGTLNGTPQYIDGACCLPIRDVSNITGASVEFVEQDGLGYVIVSQNALATDEISDVIGAYTAKF